MNNGKKPQALKQKKEMKHNQVRQGKGVRKGWNGGASGIEMWREIVCVRVCVFGHTYILCEN